MIEPTTDIKPKRPRGPSKKTRDLLQTAREEGYAMAVEEMAGMRGLAFMLWGVCLAVPAFLVGLWIG